MEASVIIVIQLKHTILQQQLALETMSQFD